MARVLITGGTGVLGREPRLGLERIPFPYYRQKLAAESIVERGGVPWSIPRATQFRTLLDMFLRPVAWMPVALLATDFRFRQGFNTVPGNPFGKSLGATGSPGGPSDENPADRAGRAPILCDRRAAL